MTTLRKGSRGEEVKQLQTLLGIKADGIFGAQTEEAVKAYQAAHNLTADGIAGIKTQTALGMATSADIILPCENLKQFSSPHGSKPYGPDSTWSTYKSGACGPTSLAVVHRALGLAPEGESSTNTIQRLGKYAWEHGYRKKGQGTTCGLFNTNGTKYEYTGRSDKIEDAIRSGKFVILLIKKGFPNGYTGNGHYIVAYGIEGDTVLLRDVGSSSASRQKAPLAKITTGLKGAYIITKR